MRKLLFFIIVGVGIILTVTSVPADALTLNFELNVEYTGGAEPDGPTPWLTAEITDTSLPADTVRITMSASGLVESEFVGGWYFNWDFDAADLDPTDGIAFLPTSTAPFGPITFDTDNLDAGGALGNGFDILFNFPQPSGNRFEANEIAIYEFLGEGLSASSFNYKNTAGNFYSAAHVQVIDNDDFPNADSGWIGATESISAIPEPGTILLLGAGLASLFGIRRFKFKTN